MSRRTHNNSKEMGMDTRFAKRNTPQRVVVENMAKFGRFKQAPKTHQQHDNAPMSTAQEAAQAERLYFKLISHPDDSRTLMKLANILHITPEAIHAEVEKLSHGMRYDS